MMDFRGARWVRRYRAVWVVLALAFAPLTQGQEVARIPIIDAPPGTAGLGVGMRLDSVAYAHGDDGLDLVPLYLYEGEWLFAHGTSAGVHVFRNHAWHMDLVGRYRFTRLKTDSAELQGVKERQQTVDVGAAFGINGRWGALDVEYVGDALDRHNGHELTLSYRYRLDIGRGMFSPWVSLAWQDSALTDYYYGVSAEEAAPGRAEYFPGAAVNLGFGINSSYALSKRVMVFANIGVFGLDDAIQDSPLVEESMSGAAYLGAAYMFGNVLHSTDVAQYRMREWSWRINGGYQALGSFANNVATGDLRPHDEVDAGIAGITLGKLVLDGPRVDFYGRFALYRHFESSYQNNFWSYTPYVAAVAKGYAPWSEVLTFRYGFGVGFSYAQRVPYVEQKRQARKEGHTSHLLNYLEWMVDFPLDRLFQSKALRGCYGGLTDVHRSGMFAAADMLGNVSGGSDWVTFHVECVR